MGPKLKSIGSHGWGPLSLTVADPEMLWAEAGNAAAE